MPTIYKNGLIYGGAAGTASLIAATNSSNGASNVQAELDKKVEKSAVVNSTNTSTAGYVADARAVKTVNDNCKAYSGSIAAGATKTVQPFTSSRGSVLIAMGHASSTQTRGLWVVTSAGSVYPIQAAPGITITVNSGTISIQNTASVSGQYIVI